jgi:histidinol-phosphate aminotransferase
MYKVLADKYNVTYRSASLTSKFELDIEALVGAVDPMTAMVFLCSPNNPTGNSLDLKVMKELLNALHTLVVVDEAYIDFSQQESMISMIDRYPNLLVVRTLSKAYGLAGARLGVGASSKTLIEWLNRIKPPYNVNSLSQQQALNRLETPEIIDKEINEIIVQRNLLSDALKTTSWVKQVFPSDANFILIQVDDADRRYQELLENTFVVRNRSTQHLCENTLRISVGTRLENKRLLQFLSE